MILQKEILLPAKPRGFHLITREVLSVLNISQIAVGMMNVFIKHTSASLSINENADPDVRDDMESFFNRTVTEDVSLYKHTAEGADDMTSHIKVAIIGSSINIPITDGKLNLGTWQGIYLCEHRNHASRRRIVITASGE